MRIQPPPLPPLHPQPLSSPNFTERNLPYSRIWSPQNYTRAVWRCIEDWEFKVWQWFNSRLPRWPFQYLGAANLLKSFYSPSLRHKVPHQLGLDYPSFFFRFRQWWWWEGGAALLNSAALSQKKKKNPSGSHQTNQSLSYRSISTPTLWQEKTAIAPFWNPHCTCGSSI